MLWEFRWNVSLSAEDVKLRLPSDGTYWAKEEPVTTPFFNVWDTAMAKIGKPVSFLPSHFSSLADREKEADTGASTSEHACTVGQSLGTRPVDISTIGSFSYCIEATESLNRIVKFFLQQPVDFQSKEEFSAWLTRFKELDLQLIQCVLIACPFAFFFSIWLIVGKLPAGKCFFHGDGKIRTFRRSRHSCTWIRT